MSVNRRKLLTTWVAAGAAAEVAILTAGCATGEPSPDPGDQISGQHSALTNPYEFGAVGDGKHDDTVALRSAYDAAVASGTSVELTNGRYFIPGHLEMVHPGVSLVSRGGTAVIGGGEVRVGPNRYEAEKGGVDFSGTEISGITFNQKDDYGTQRCLVIRNVRGLDVVRNNFTSAGKGIAVETSDGNDKFHTTAMLRIESNRFAKLSYGIYGASDRWDRYSDWQIIDNFFNFCSDTSVWIASPEEEGMDIGGLDGLVFSGNFLFSQNYSRNEDPLFPRKRHNLRLGKSNWVCINYNNFFEAGLSAVYLEAPQNFTFVGNHVAWPGQRELADCLEIRKGSPVGVIDSNTFAQWTRAAVGLYDLDDYTRIEVGQNAWQWEASPVSWTGSGDLPGYRVYASAGGVGLPTVRDFQTSGTYDALKGSSLRQSRDVKSPKGGITGASLRHSRVSGATNVFRISDIVNTNNFGGLITVTASNSLDDSQIATYLLFVSSQGSKCTVIESGGYTDGAEEGHPSFTWTLEGADLIATPVGAANGVFHFDAVAIGAASPS